MTISGGTFDILCETHEERAEDWDRSKYDNKPHFCEHPCVKLVDPVRQVIVSNGGDCDCFVDTGDTSSGYLLV